MVREQISIQITSHRGRGIATGRGMLAAMTLGADGVQMGSRLLLQRKSSAP